MDRDTTSKPVDGLSAELAGRDVGTEPSDSKSPSGSGFGSNVRAGLGFLMNWFIVPIAIVLVLHFYVFQAYHVVGSSMVPTLHESDYLIVSKVDASWQRLIHPANARDAFIPKRDQIVVFKYPAKPDVVFVKRVIGLPGDRVVIQDGKVTIYNKDNPQGFNPDANHLVSDPVTLDTIDETVPPGNIFVLGDNRTPGGSFDSRDWGYLPSYDIIGTAVLRLLPVSEFKVLGVIVF